MATGLRYDYLPAPLCVLLAGEIAVGKSSVGTALGERIGGSTVRVREALAEVVGVKSPDRATLQEQGAQLDQRTNGRWLLEYIERRRSATPLVVDSLRTRRQTVPILEQVNGSRLVYLHADWRIRQERFNASREADPVKHSMGFDEAMRHPTEVEVRGLRPLAHVVIETDRLTVDQVVAELINALHP
jgi:shikimate kinase